METFDFPYHSCSVKNPESGFRGQFGNSYTFTAEPSAPDQRVLVLKFPVLKYFVTAGVVDETVQPEINMKALIDFYQVHKMHTSFHYTHPVHGMLEVKFNKPLEEPSVELGSDGACLNVEVELLEIPG